MAFDKTVTIYGKHNCTILVSTYGNTQLIEICILQVFHEFLINDSLCPDNIQGIIVFFLNPRFEIIVIQLKLFRKQNISYCFHHAKVINILHLTKYHLYKLKIFDAIYTKVNTTTLSMPQKISSNH